MPIFPRAKNFVIQGGEFMDIGVQNNIVHGPSGKLYRDGVDEDI